MSILIAVGRSLVWIWPFISEIFFDGKSFKTIIKENKLVICLLVALVLSLSFTYISMHTLHRVINEDTVKPITISQHNSLDFNGELNHVNDRLKKIYEETTLESE